MPVLIMPSRLGQNRQSIFTNKRSPTKIEKYSFIFLKDTELMYR